MIEHLGSSHIKRYSKLAMMGSRYHPSPERDEGSVEVFKDIRTGFATSRLKK